MTKEQETKFSRAIIDGISAASDVMEKRLQESLTRYIDAQRKGVLYRDSFCCKQFKVMANKYWNPGDARIWFDSKPTADLYADKRENGTRSIHFRGEPFNYCPFCGSKL